MITLQQILSRCTDEQLDEILDASNNIMYKLEEASGASTTELAMGNEFYWKVYGVNQLTFTEIVGRANGVRARIAEPICSTSKPQENAI